MSVLAKLSMGLAAVALVGPVLIKSAGHSWAGVPWHQASRAPSGLAPDPADEPRAVVQVYAAQTWGWRGVVAVHTWIVTKPADGDAYTRWDVVGWGGGRVVRRNYAAPDAMWYGQRPRLLADRRGDAAAALIPGIEAAVASYPFPERYRSYPGPNSNTFTAHVARSVPALGLDLPPTAIGKDYRELDGIVGRAPSGGGVQLSLFGLAGLILSPEEGVEINILGLSVGLDVASPALRLPALGRIGVDP
ncbi:DUF3750 domain-containing protein [Thalassobaculum sp.]|uniref:DUF3750 domain-containing protein n=1 Tax=Thalassobaculum sp. TaxID=2022740 RepID=UPI0032EB6B9B